jgi:hypothetical protein
MAQKVLGLPPMAIESVLSQLTTIRIKTLVPGSVHLKSMGIAPFEMVRPFLLLHEDTRLDDEQVSTGISKHS